jgi:hypothetical protein
MYDILKGQDVFQRALPSPPTRRWAVEQLRHELDKVIQYRRGNARRVDSDHLLVRLIESLDISVLLSDQDYVWGVSDNALRVANALKMTSMWGHGGPFSPGVFYSTFTTEVVIAVIDDFDVKEARKHWEDLMPIRVMTHPFNDLNLPYLDGYGDGLETIEGWAVTVVNIPMLAFQHKCWWETYCKNNPDSPPPISLFFGRYPLTNMLASHLDITLLNRTMAMDLEQPLQELKNANPFYVNFQQAGQTDRMIDYALTFMQRSNLSFDDWLDAVPQASVNNVHEWLALPDLRFVTQVEWAIFLARLPVMGWLLAHNAKLDSRYNNQYVINIRHWVQRMKSGRFFHQGLRGEQLAEVTRIIDQTIVPYI